MWLFFPVQTDRLRVVGGGFYELRNCRVVWGCLRRESVMVMVVMVGGIDITLDAFFTCILTRNGRRKRFFIPALRPHYSRQSLKDRKIPIRICLVSDTLLIRCLVVVKRHFARLESLCVARKRGWIDGQSGVAHSHRQTLTVVQLFVLKAGQKQAKGSQLELVQLDNWHRSVLLCFVYLVEWFSANKTHCWHVCWDIISHERSFLFRFAKCTVHTLFSECIINLLGSGSSSFEPPFTIFPTFDSIHFISFNSILYTFISYYL